MFKLFVEIAAFTHKSGVTPKAAASVFTALDAGFRSPIFHLGRTEDVHWSGLRKNGSCADSRFDRAEISFVSNSEMAFAPRPSGGVASQEGSANGLAETVLNAHPPLKNRPGISEMTARPVRRTSPARWCGSTGRRRSWPPSLRREAPDPRLA